MSWIAVIPARGGSKRITRKNIRSFHGIPLLARAVTTALDSGLFERVVVSTDDPEIAATAARFGASVPFERPAELADDYTPTVPVIRHALIELGKSGYKPEVVCCLYPSAVFVHPRDLCEAARHLRELAHPRFIACVTSFPHPIQRALEMGADGVLSPVEPASISARSQDLAKRWHDAGQFYFGHRDLWLQQPEILQCAEAYEMDSWRVQDIDTEEDWRRAEMIFRLIMQESHDRK